TLGDDAPGVVCEGVSRNSSRSTADVNPRSIVVEAVAADRRRCIVLDPDAGGRVPAEGVVADSGVGSRAADAKPVGVVRDGVVADGDGSVARGDVERPLRRTLPSVADDRVRDRAAGTKPEANPAPGAR